VHESYLVVGCKPWNYSSYTERLVSLPGHWHYIGSQEELTAELVRELSPRYIFFLHWSWKVPPQIVGSYECVCFHMTDVPYGRGGGPLQNLIQRGHKSTKLTALRMTDELDAGPVYLKEPLSLEGSAEDIYQRASRISAAMVERIVRERPNPTSQQGEVVTFTRRKPWQSRIDALRSLEEMHDFIRMLDADGYPPAFLEYAGFRFEFSRSALCQDHVAADVKITRAQVEERGK
jgi:methionyl-tRNA formyltransferase